jgi:hypothetical protein
MSLDEPFDHHVSRPAARWLAPRLHALGIGADAVSMAALGLGVTAGVCLGAGGRWPLLGGALLLGMIIGDCADGEVARLGPPPQNPWRGRMLDGFADLGTVVAVHVGMAVHVAHGETWRGVAPTGLGAAGLFALAFMALVWKSSVLDDIKQRLTRTSSDAALPRYLAQAEGRAERLLLWLFLQYTRQAARLAVDGRAASAETFRLVAWVGPTHHLAAIALAGLLTPLVPHAFALYALATLVPGNAWLSWVLLRVRAPSH